MANITIVDSTMINVLNYSSSQVSLPTQINPEGYLFSPAIDGEPSLFPMSFAEIRVANGQSQIFREGHLRFDKEIEADVYKALHIRDWEDILSDEEIKDTLLNPTKEKLERLIKITTMSAFDRIRGIMTSLNNLGIYDISSRVMDLVHNRYAELYRGQKISEITISKTKQESVNESQSEIIANEIAKAKAELEQKIRAEIEAELKANIKVEPKVDTVEKVTPKVENKPQAGRPKSK